MSSRRDSVQHRVQGEGFPKGSSHFPILPASWVCLMFSLIKLLPPALKKLAHEQSGLAHLRIILIKGPAVVKHQGSISSKLLTARVPGKQGKGSVSF